MQMEAVMGTSRALSRRLRRLRAVLYGTAVLATVLALLAYGAPGDAAARLGPAATGSHRAAVLRVRAESKALAARSDLTTAQLIRAAKLARSRLPVHSRPAAPRDIPVHPPIMTRAGAGAAQQSAPGVNGHCEIRVGGLGFSGLAATSFPGWWPAVLPAGRG
jgi:hypothetical protein